MRILKPRIELVVLLLQVLLDEENTGGNAAQNTDNAIQKVEDAFINIENAVENDEGVYRQFYVDSGFGNAIGTSINSIQRGEESSWESSQIWTMAASKIGETRSFEKPSCPEPVVQYSILTYKMETQNEAAIRGVIGE